VRANRDTLGNFPPVESGGGKNNVIVTQSLGEVGPAKLQLARQN